VPMLKNQTKEPHLPGLDGLRAIAILMVFAFHARVDLPVRVQKLFSTGWCGVDLFFVLSGFLITGGLLRTKSSTNYFRSFYARRVLRIFPVYYLALALIYGVLPMFYSRVTLPPRRDGIIYALYLNNWEPLMRTLATRDAGHFWSLAVEEQFYLLWPAVVLLCSRRRLYAVASTGFLIAPLLRWWLLNHGIPASTIYRNTFCRMDCLMAGALCSLLVSVPEITRWVRRAALPMICLSVAAWAVFSYSTDPFSATEVIFGYTVNPTCFAGLVLACTTRARWASWFGCAPVRRIAAWSYGMYVYHVFFLDFAAMIPWLHPGRIRFAAELGATIVTAALSYHFFESRILRYKTHFAPVWSSEDEAIASTT
jgi:peptidoglycan/LPS O-acetylase OafA/YrhL